MHKSQCVNDTDYVSCIVHLLSLESLMHTMILKVHRLSQDATLPKRASKGSVGYDLSSATHCVIPARGKGLVLTNLSIQVPPGCYGRVAPRSGVAWKHHIDVGAGVIDQDYRGDVGVVLFNHAKTDFKVAKGDRIAQLILEKCLLVEVEDVSTLEETQRGSGGFGSTGMSSNIGVKKITNRCSNRYSIHRVFVSLVTLLFVFGLAMFVKQ
jgi:dUTP pyrophosphatase